MGTTFADERRTLEAYFKSGFETPNPSVPVFYDNQNFTRPDETVSFVTFYLLPGFGNQVTLGPGAMERRVGIIQANVYTPAQAGAKAGSQLADTIETLFRLKDIVVPGNGIIRTRTSRLHAVGVRDGHYMLVLSIPYQYDSF